MNVNVDQKKMSHFLFLFFFFCGKNQEERTKDRQRAFSGARALISQKSLKKFSGEAKAHQVIKYFLERTHSVIKDGIGETL